MSITLNSNVIVLQQKKINSKWWGKIGKVVQIVGDQGGPKYIVKVEDDANNSCFDRELCFFDNEIMESGT